MLTPTETYLIGAVAILALLGLVQFVAWWAGGNFLTTVILGEDNRTSTSKTFVFMWTLLVGWALICLLIVGELIATHRCAAITDITAATKACTAANDQIGLLQIGWRAFLTGGLAGSYLVVLGIPATAAVAAKGITQGKVAAGTLTKAKAPANQKAINRVAQIFSADDQTTDIGDFQYVLFNLITAVYFVVQFIQPAGQGLPALPDTLLGLTSVSAALYVGKKAVTRDQPKITGVFPSVLAPNTLVTVIGSGLTTDPGTGTQSPGIIAPQITIDGQRVLDARPDPQIADRLTGTVPAGLVAADAQTPVVGKLQVLSAYSVATPSVNVQLSR